MEEILPQLENELLGILAQFTPIFAIFISLMAILFAFAYFSGRVNPLDDDYFLTWYRNNRDAGLLDNSKTYKQQYGLFRDEYREQVKSGNAYDRYNEFSLFAFLMVLSGKEPKTKKKDPNVFDYFYGLGGINAPPKNWSIDKNHHTTVAQPFTPDLPIGQMFYDDTPNRLSDYYDNFYQPSPIITTNPNFERSLSEQMQDMFISQNAHDNDVNSRMYQMFYDNGVDYHLQNIQDPYNYKSQVA